MTIRVERDGELAIVRLDNPPANAISAAVRAALMQTVATLVGDAGVRGVVLAGSDSIFAAGADVREFDTPPAPPHLPDVIAALEASPQPWVAAIQGAALGGGCELALGCRMRIAARDARIGLPEVTLGVVPGAGGTQRLPRLVGLKTALDIIAFGRVLPADEALRIGLVDRIEDDPVAAARTLLRDVGHRMPAPLAHRDPGAPDPEAVEHIKSQVSRRMRGQIAPLRAVELVELATQADFATAIKRERQTFLELRSSEQARALRHLFFAERAARAPAQIGRASAPDVRSAVVVGGGTMGTGIAYALQRAGYETTLVETDDDARVRAEGKVRSFFRAAVERRLLSEAEAAMQLGCIRFVTGFSELPPADLAIEAVFEDMEVKRVVFRELDRALPTRALIATNTSYLDVNEIAAATERPDKVLGLHFFSPAHVMRLLEIVKGARTSDATLAAAFQIARKLNKVPVLAGVCDGFIGNRILARYREEADSLLLEGSLPWAIDRAMVEFGMAMGPYETQDLAGLDIAYAQRKRKAASRDPARRYVRIADRLVENKRLGRKTGAGWYRYDESGSPRPDRFVENLIDEEASLARVHRREIPDEEIRTRLTMAMVNEAAAILHEGIAAAPSDVDLVLVHGYGFPRWRGGLMFYADGLGVRNVLTTIEDFAKSDPIVWKPSALLRELAADGRSFADWHRDRARASPPIGERAN